MTMVERGRKEVLRPRFAFLGGVRPTVHFGVEDMVPAPEFLKHLLQDVHIEQPAKLAPDFLQRPHVHKTGALVQVQAFGASFRRRVR